MPELEGIPHRFEIPIWHRGPARIAQNKPGASKLIVLDQRRARLYAIVSSEDLLFDLERVTDEESALQFVGKYGLLSETESLSGVFVGAWVMPLDQFLWVAKSIRTCLQIYRWLKPALDDDPDALAELRKLEVEAREITGRGGLGVELDPAGRDLILALKQRATKSPGARATDPELLSLMAQALAFLINIGLAGVEERMSASIAWPQPREGTGWPRDAFTLDARPKTLLGAAFHHLALVVLNRRPLDACERCGSLYFREDPRQRFCTTTCADRARRERHSAKRSAKTTRKGARKAAKK